MPSPEETQTGPPTTAPPGPRVEDLIEGFKMQIGAMGEELATAHAVNKQLIRQLEDQQEHIQQMQTMVDEIARSQSETEEKKA